MTPDEEFYKQANNIFEEKLHYEEIDTVLIKDMSKNIILNSIPYSKILFDSDLNIYKKENGTITKVDNPNFKAVVVKTPVFNR